MPFFDIINMVINMNDSSDMIPINIDKNGKVFTINVSYVYNYDDTYPPIVIPFKGKKHSLTKEDVLSAIKKCYESLDTDTLAIAIKSIGKFELEYVLCEIPEKFDGTFMYMDPNNITNSNKYFLVTILKSTEYDAVISLGLFIFCANKEFINNNFVTV